MPDSTSMWPTHLDALRAAPEHHRLLLENDSVRVLETKIAPGEITKLHTHRWPAACYLLSTSDFIRRDQSGAINIDSRTLAQSSRPGQAAWLPSLEPHTLENIGTTLIHVISVEVKCPAP